MRQLHCTFPKVRTHLIMLPWRRTLVACLLLLWSPRATCAQSLESNLWFVRSGITPGFILPTNPFGTRADGANDPIHVAPNLTIEVGRRTDGTSTWHQLYGTPSYGFGMSLVPLPNGGEHGRPIEAHVLLWPFARLSDHLQVTTEFGAGLSWRWKHMNARTDAYEDVLGSNLNARVDWGFYVRYLSTPRIAVLTGVDYTHRSNGGMVQPDLGINVIGPKVAVQHNLAAEAPARRDIDPPPFQPAWEFLVGGLGGVKNVVQRKIRSRERISECSTSRLRCSGIFINSARSLAGLTSRAMAQRVHALTGPTEPGAPEPASVGALGCIAVTNTSLADSVPSCRLATTSRTVSRSPLHRASTRAMAGAIRSTNAFGAHCRSARAGFAEPTPSNSAQAIASASIDKADGAQHYLR